jgi:hypothetical protein
MRGRLTVALALALLLAGAAAGQGNFRITYNVERTPQQLRVIGWVSNDAAFDALDVYVTAEALDATGKVVARGIAFVAAQIPSRGTAGFSAPVPAAGKTVSRVRVGVSSFRMGLGPQS